MTLGIASETHSLALISLVVEKYRAAGASMGILERDVPQLAWDVRAAKEDVDDWVNGTVTYADRVVPANERDAVLARQAPLNKESGLQNRLEERVFEELRMALGCLNANGV
jgi:nuclear pore complex protein Nup188